MPDREYFNNRRKNRRMKFIDLLGGKCERCGATDGLQFDHRQPNKKEFRIADRIDAPEDILMKEVMKCVLLCAKCHRDKTREMGEHGQPEARHGTLWMYKHYGCRCDKCKQRMSEYNKERRLLLSAMENGMKLDDMVEYFRKLASYRDVQTPSEEIKPELPKEKLEPITDEEAIELGIVKAPKASVEKAVELLGLMAEKANGDQTVLEIAVNLSKVIDEKDFDGAFDLLKDLAKAKVEKDLVLELAHVIADIRNDARLAEFEDE